MRWVDNVTLLLTPVKSTLIIFENLKIIFSLINMSIISPSSINLERNLLSATCKGFYDDNKRVYLKLMNVNVMFGKYPNPPISLYAFLPNSSWANHCMMSTTQPWSQRDPHSFP